MKHKLIFLGEKYVILSHLSAYFELEENTHRGNFQDFHQSGNNHDGNYYGQGSDKLASASENSA
jgi:hypothetical protein